MVEYYYGNPYPCKVNLQGTEYLLPKGFRIHEIKTPTLTGKISITDHRGNPCDFKIINNQPCLISINGAWDIFENKDAVRIIGGG